MDKLEEICKKVRKALELSESSVRPVTMTYFPKGSCQTSSLILAEILAENGFGLCKIVSGMMGDYSHSWLELNGIYIDITQDQFEGGNPIYIDGPSYYNSKFTDIYSCVYIIRFEMSSIENDSLYPLYLDIKNRIKSNFI